MGLFLARDAENFLAVKAGGNDDSHNHNDTGSIIYYKKAKPVLIDIGVETYSRKTFSPERYDIWTMQSAYHNVLTFGNIMQKAGAEYHADVLDVALKTDPVRIDMELAGCYPPGTVSGYRRTVEFKKGKWIRVADHFHRMQKGVFLTLMTVEKPRQQDNVLYIGELEKLYFDGNIKAEIEEIELSDTKLKKEWGRNLYRTKYILLTVRLLLPSGWMKIKVKG